MLDTLSLTEEPLALEFYGLGNFRNQVLYAAVKEGTSTDRLKTMAGLA